MTEQEQQEYLELERQKCVTLGEHFKRIVSSQGYDICFNCGNKE